MNNLITNLLKEESNTYKGKKLLANGPDSLSFNDIHDQLRQTYALPEKSIKNKNQLMVKLTNNWQLFFHGNTHVTNFNFMLDYLNAKSPKFSDYECASALIKEYQEGFREYYAEKKQKTNDRINIVKDQEPEDLRYPALQNYHKISLD